METMKKFYVSNFDTYSKDNKANIGLVGLGEIGVDGFKYFRTLSNMIDLLVKNSGQPIVYFNNLKYYGRYIVEYLLSVGYTQAYNTTGERIFNKSWKTKKEMENNSFRYLVATDGTWYNIIIKSGNKEIEIRNLDNILPMTLSEICEGFEIKQYPKTNDILKNMEHKIEVLKNIVQILIEENLTELTIGKCCMKIFKDTMLFGSDLKTLMPDLTLINIDREMYGSETADEYIRNSYHGGWCYVAEDRKNKIIHNGVTLDVNSLYASMMHSKSGNKYPLGLPKFWTGDIPQEALADNKYYFVRISTRFRLKENHLPFIQIKDSMLYDPSEMLKTSDIYDRKTGRYVSCYMRNDELIQCKVILTLTMTDYELLKKHYDLYDTEVLDGCYFFSQAGIFDNYIDKFMKIKKESTGAKRQIAKLLLNNLTGKLASSRNSSYKIAVENNGSLIYIPIKEEGKKAGYIPCGSAITSYSRNFTITAAQTNYDTFCYSDTDSLHCDTEVEEIIGVEIDKSELCKWKVENTWDKAIFIRQKAYIEHSYTDNGYENTIKCAGLPENCKALLSMSLDGIFPNDLSEYNENEINFLLQKRDYTDFKIGLTIPSKKMPKKINGGIVYEDTDFTISV